MRDQDYIQIMDRISKDKIEEAFTWNASVNQKRHSIRRLSTGIGAIAAAIAIVVGGIGYHAYRDKQFPSSGDDNSRIGNDGQNLFGGHGEIRGFVGSSGNTLFRDDEYYYLSEGIHSDGEKATEGGASPDSFDYLRWEMNGSTAIEQFEYDGRLLTDGEQLYTYHDGKLFVTDSYGSETAFSDVPWKPCAIQKLSEGLYFLSAFVEDSWIDGDPKPYVLLNQNDGTSNFVGFGDVRPDSKGEEIYFRRENQIYRAPLIAPDEATLIADAGQEPDALADWTVADDTLYYVYTANGTVMYDTKPVNADTTQGNMERVSTDDPDPTHHLWEYDYFGKQKTELFTATYTYRDGDLEFHVTAAGAPLFPPGASSNCYFYSVSAAELWGDDLPDTNERPFMEFFDTEAHIIFTLPQDGKNGEQIMQLGKESGDQRTLSYRQNAVPEQPKTEQIQEDQTQDAAAFNALGGRGAIRCFYSDYGCGFAEDDEYYYDLSNNLRARKTDGDTVYEEFTLQTVPQYDPEHHPDQELFVTDNMVLFFEDGTLYDVRAHGNKTSLTNTTYTIILELTEDNEGNPIEHVELTDVQGFAKDAEGRPTRLFLRGGARITGRPADDPGYSFNAILDLETGKFCDLVTYGNVIEWMVTDDAVYADGYGLTTQVPVTNEPGDPAFDSSYYELVRFNDNGTLIQVSTPEWGFGGFLDTGIDDDGYTWFVNMENQYCKGNVQDGSVTVISESEYRTGYSNIHGGKGYVYIDDNPQRIVFRKPDGVSEIVLKEDKEYPTQRFRMSGSYCENGIIHIVITESEISDAGEAKAIRNIIYVIDGNSVSSNGIRFPA